jgi:hypothetical protein
MHPIIGEPYANNQMAWLLTKGQDLHSSEPTHATTVISVDYWPGENPISDFSLLACDEDKSPDHCEHKVNRQMINLSIANDPQAIYHVANVTVDLKDVPRHCISTYYSSDGRAYYSIRCTINISLQSGLEFFVTVGGKKYGSVTVDYK